MEPLQLKYFESSEATLTSVQIELHEVKIIEVSEQGKDVVDVSSGEGNMNGCLTFFCIGPVVYVWCTSTKKKTWWSPKLLLLIFCLMNLLNYVDCGVIASTGVNGTPKVCRDSGECIIGKEIQGSFNLKNFQDGALSTTFMVGLLISSPIFASLAKTYNKPFKLISVGLLIWTTATSCCGITSSFQNVLLENLVGVGEASFISLAATFMNGNAPSIKKMFCLGLFYMCIPVGIAIGYVYGGFVASYFNRRCDFFGEAILVPPFFILCFFMEPLQLKVFVQGKDVVDVLSGERQFNKNTSRKTYLSKRTIKQILKGTIKRISRFWKDMFWKNMKVLLLKKVYVVSVLGYAAYTFVIGSYSYWRLKAGADIYHMTNTDMFFGGTTLICGVRGMLAGGYLLDRINSSIKNSMYGFLAFFVLGQLFLFGAQPSLRPISLSISTVMIHILGNVPSSPLRTSTLILTSIFAVAAGIRLIGIFLDNVD
ncbi:hypothetical protein MKX03_036068 [Papaver bracteatum]|nr:hypothetical protein MKX03_036068 [Papaver bracteatum]